MSHYSLLYSNKTEKNKLRPKPWPGTFNPHFTDWHMVFLLELYGYYKRDVNRNDIRLWLRSTPFNNIDSLILCNRSHYCCEKSLDVHWKDVSLTQFSFNNFNRFFASFEILCIWHYLLYNYAQAHGPS